MTLNVNSLGDSGIRCYILYLVEIWIQPEVPLCGHLFSIGPSKLFSLAYFRAVCILPSSYSLHKLGWVKSRGKDDALLLTHQWPLHLILSCRILVDWGNGGRPLSRLHDANFGLDIKYLIGDGLCCLQKGFSLLKSPQKRQNMEAWDRFARKWILFQRHWMWKGDTLGVTMKTMKSQAYMVLNLYICWLASQYRKSKISRPSLQTHPSLPCRHSLFRPGTIHEKLSWVYFCQLQWA